MGPQPLNSVHCEWVLNTSISESGKAYCAGDGELIISVVIIIIIYIGPITSQKSISKLERD